MSRRSNIGKRREKKKRTREKKDRTGNCQPDTRSENKLYRRKER